MIWVESNKKKEKKITNYQQSDFFCMRIDEPVSLTSSWTMSKYGPNNEAFWFMTYFNTFRSYCYLLDQIADLQASQYSLHVARSVFVFACQSLCHSTVRGRGWSTDSIGLSGALNIVFTESDGVKRAMRSTESSHVHRVHSLKSCFLCVQSSHAVIDFLYPSLQRPPNTNVYVMRTHQCGCRWNTASRKHRRINIFWGCCTQTFPLVQWENRESRRPVIILETCFFSEEFCHRRFQNFDAIFT